MLLSLTEWHSGGTFLYILLGIPSVEIQSSSYTVAYGSQIRLQCVVNSIPPATSVDWLKTYQGVTSTINLSQFKYSGGTINDPSLRIFNAELSDEATYVCTATNIVGTAASQEMTLSVVVCKYVVTNYSINCTFFLYLQSCI